MREIKFRAWHKEDKLMAYDVAVSTDCIAEDSVFLSVSGKADWKDIKDYTLMQYTERKDKNKKMIFEGDILKCTASKHFPNDSCISDVIWGNELQWQVRSEAYNHGLPLAWSGWKSIEVIGNIYENKNLL